MVPNQAPPPSATATITTPFPPLSRSTTLPAFNSRSITNRSHLTPEDAIYAGSPPRRQSAAVNKLQKGLHMTNGNAENLRPGQPRRGRHKESNRSGSRRRKGTFQKLLWVKQSYPDNYTDQDTFLEHLQRNPRLLPYDFWPLVADSTVIVQHVCSVIIFIVCFVGIFQERVSPVAVVSWGSFFTFAGWLVWDWWVGQDPEPVTTLTGKPANALPSFNMNEASGGSAGSSVSNLGKEKENRGLTAKHSHSTSASSIHSNTSTNMVPTPHYPPPPGAAGADSSPFSHRTSLRLSTAKSALLIYFTLLGLSPILKSLTRSTSSDSIWAMSFLLFTINIFFFDYSTGALAVGGSSAKNIPASLSTNAALMASTVLASRLPSTGQVFSLTLFSIEVFGLFPVFRRYARQRSWRGHVTLTSLLVVGAGGGVGLILGHGGDGDGILDFPWKSGLMGLVVGVMVTGLAMGGCSWWLIGLQKYKNEIHGPWDPARPVIRRRWDD